MTLLIVLQFTDCAMVFHDTLVTHRDRELACFMQKLQHFRDPDVLMASTGNHGVPDLWFKIVNEAEGADVNDLHEVAPTMLREIRDAVEAKHGPVGVTTIHHLGYARGTEDLVHYEYTSRDDFAGQQIASDSILIRPTLTAGHDYAAMQSIDDVIEVAERIKEEQRALFYPSDAGGVLIGGDLYCAEITPRGVDIRQVHRFSDYDDTLRQILAAQERRRSELRPIPDSENRKEA